MSVNTEKQRLSAFHEQVAICGSCGKARWWHLQKHRGDDGHEYLSASAAKRFKGRWKWTKKKREREMLTISSEF